MLNVSLFRNEQTGRIDNHLVLFFLNALLVIVTYWFANVIGDIASIKFARTALIVLSIWLLLAERRKQFIEIINGRQHVVLLYIFLNVLFLPFSENMMQSLIRLCMFIPFLFYLNLFSVYLIQHYSKEELMLRLLKAFRVIYFFPVINYFTYNFNFSVTSIYGNESLGFTSNNYGWASVFFLLTNIDVLLNEKSKNTRERLFWILLNIPAIYLLLISGSRSGYLSMAIAMVIYVLFNRATGLLFKGFVILVGLFLFLQIQYDENFALNSRMRQTENKEKEERLIIAEAALSVVEKNTFVLLFGVGFDNFVEGVNKYTNHTMELAAHNSYLQIVVESGVFVFAFFFIGFFLNAIFKYLKFHVRKFLFICPLLVIPFFESNYGAGQFLFFPWIGTMILYIHFNSYPVIEEEEEDNILPMHASDAIHS